MKTDEAKQLKELEVENCRLKEMLAETKLDKRILNEALKRNYKARHGTVKLLSTFPKFLANNEKRQRP